jgi:hypothetical protein
MVRRLFTEPKKQNGIEHHETLQPARESLKAGVISIDAINADTENKFH